jgi:hypothetical protein
VRRADWDLCLGWRRLDWCRLWPRIDNWGQMGRDALHTRLRGRDLDYDTSNWSGLMMVRYFLSSAMTRWWGNTRELRLKRSAWKRVKRTPGQLMRWWIDFNLLRRWGGGISKHTTSIVCGLVEKIDAKKPWLSNPFFLRKVVHPYPSYIYMVELLLTRWYCDKPWMFCNMAWQCNWIHSV